MVLRAIGHSVAIRGFGVRCEACVGLCDRVASFGLGTVNLTGTQFEIRLVDVGSAEYPAALHRALDLPWSSFNGQIHARAADLLASLGTRPQDNSFLISAYDAGRLVSACLVVSSPGASALVYAPSGREVGFHLEATIAVLRAVQEEARDRGLVLLESLLPPDACDLRLGLKQAGFRHLTRLLYFRRGRSNRVVAPRRANDLKWVRHTTESTPLFHQAIRDSYVQSLDCPELVGIRTVEQVLDGHRAVGEHDPSLWWVATRAGEPVGVLLLSRIPARDALELVYVGVSQAARGSGVGDALVERAIEAAGGPRSRVLMLAVDERNTPARQLYSRWGFVETRVRDAWIATPRPARG